MTSLRLVTGGLFVAVPLLLVGGFTGLQMTFEYPDILRHTAGEVLTRLSDYWYRRTSEVVPNCLVAVVEAGNARELGLDVDASFFGRSMVVRRAEPVKVECVVRGYITGSGWAEYQRSGTVTGIRLPEGLQQSQMLFEPIFTPLLRGTPEQRPPLTDLYLKTAQ